jgi:hypothetical protein
MVREALAALLLVVVPLGVGLGACAGKTIEAEDGPVAGGGSAGKPSKPAPTTSPVAQCKTLASTWCNKAFGCYVKVGRMSESLAKTNTKQCIDLFVEHAPCAEVTSVGADYNQCIAQIKAMDCKQWNVPQEQFGTIGEPVSCEMSLAFD